MATLQESTELASIIDTDGSLISPDSSTSNPPLHYYLEVAGITGDVTAKGFSGDFEVDGFSFGSSNPAGTGSAGSGAGAGKVTSSPLTVDISSLQGLSPLLEDELVGRDIKSVELLGVNDNGQTVYSLDLTNAVLTSWDNTPGAATVDTALTFDYERATVTDHGVTSDGGLGPAQTAEFSGGSATPPALPESATPVPAGSTLHYYLEVAGITGDVTAKGFSGDFEVDGFSFGSSNPAGTGSAGSGAGAGKVTFSPLTVDINSLQGLSPLLEDELVGRNIKSVDLIGVNDSGQTVYNLDLTNAVLTSWETAPDTDKVEALLTFEGERVTVTSSAPCFCAGVLVRTERGEIAVENLSIGDEILIAAGIGRPIKWIGRRNVATRFADPLMAWPVRIKAGALGDNVPSRDLLLSPDHAILVDDVLIQAGALVNGSSIIRETAVPEIFTYYHVELSDHSLILAENTPAETFIDNVDRLAFDNWDEHCELYPEGKPIVELPYPRAKAHRQVPRSIRERLAARAALLERCEAAA
jgi:Hint domain/Type VI secretion system effector, Hcp